MIINKQVLIYFINPARLSSASGFGACPLKRLYNTIGFSVPP